MINYIPIYAIGHKNNITGKEFERG